MRTQSFFYFDIKRAPFCRIPITDARKMQSTISLLYWWNLSIAMDLGIPQIYSVFKSASFVAISIKIRQTLKSHLSDLLEGKLKLVQYHSCCFTDSFDFFR